MSKFLCNEDENENEMKKFNVQSKTEVSLVYCTCTNQTKKFMEKELKRKPLSSPVSVKVVRWKG